MLRSANLLFMQFSAAQAVNVIKKGHVQILVHGLFYSGSRFDRKIVARSMLQ